MEDEDDRFVLFYFYFILYLILYGILVMLNLSLFVFQTEEIRIISVEIHFALPINRVMSDFLEFYT